jgi:hypothetical protein
MPQISPVRKYCVKLSMFVVSGSCVEDGHAVVVFSDIDSGFAAGPERAESLAVVRQKVDGKWSLTS